MIENGSQVKLHIILAVNDEILDNSVVQYTHGEGGLLGGLQAHLLGMKVGEKKECIVAPEQAYGERDDDRLLRVLPKFFGDDLDKLEVGTILHGNFSNTECDATVFEITEDCVVLDLNHPLAGKALQFAVEIIEVHPPQNPPELEN
jgi:FKBP-type peptidyl-prolyl cis-trans isomerase 2